MMVKKTFIVRLDEISKIDIVCGSCKVKIQYDLEKGFKANRCPVCDIEHEEAYYKGLLDFQDALQRIPKENKALISFEIELKEN
ncbi:hypothetical protein MYX64_09900 [Nitrospinae bacterium AH_259_B05_G02_I21]|nr:hypothetical protein [Nitrospinae bacterium AH_259_B05_G02_I21]MDA2932681.1 hypothetical protein [Nitrospinae bacterium AH-259-F20]